ncbi:hypothetical protein [Limnoglobus roseus]|uniref:Uncharacterized protein n=1 Tax=Limnoglobus roseus TaxID=2598579 RepID=A0A5C1AM03_9BACT|nr:hypothetical protein [Limnoglobus roseus]QEL18762.1 hypothetical protein PX52LOC_05800 [Limnoglobus roseus]
MTNTPADLIRRTDEIREHFPHYWRDEQAQAELAAIWGEAINPQGVFVDHPNEVLYDRDGCKASISIGTAKGVFAFGCSYQTPTQGYGSAPSIWDDLFGSYSDARAAAIEFLLARLPTPEGQHEVSERVRIDRMRNAIAAPLRQPSLF